VLQAWCRAADTKLLLAFGYRMGRSQKPGELALDSGGFAFHPTTAEELHTIFVLLAGELRWQYLIGFLPATNSDIEK
jgi:hypothetical protein